jgi:hypothetical protein
MGRAYSTLREKQNLYKVLVGKSAGKWPLGKQRRIYVDNIKIDFKRDRMELDGQD